MTVQLLTPQGMTQPTPYHHVAISVGRRQVHISGQVARDGAGNPVAGGDLGGQVAQALRNIALGLSGAEASFADVVRLNFYVTHWSPAKMAELMSGIDAVSHELAIPQPMPPVTLIGVAALFEPDVLVEVEATAVLD